jgi:SAM-dependent methyltransferase
MLESFAESFGTTAEDVSTCCCNDLKNIDFSYTDICGTERDNLILNILNRIDVDKQVIGDTKRQQVWDKGWRENLDEFISSGYDLNKLVPKFIRPDQPVRYNLKYIQPFNPDFELNYFSMFRHWLFKSYLSNYRHIYEFGCGTGFNLVALAQMYPEKKLYGLDFVHSSVDLLTKIAEHCGYSISGHLFDMTYLDTALVLEPNSAILTIGSIEQLAGRFKPFIDYLLTQPVSLCIHVEPLIELCDENNLVDYLAIKFLNKRGYTKGFLSYLKDLESEKRIEILKVKRLYFGSLFMEGYNYIIWRPKNRSGG